MDGKEGWRRGREQRSERDLELISTLDEIRHTGTGGIFFAPTRDGLLFRRRMVMVIGHYSSTFFWRYWHETRLKRDSWAVFT